MIEEIADLLGDLLGALDELGELADFGELTLEQAAEIDPLPYLAELAATADAPDVDGASFVDVLLAGGAPSGAEDVALAFADGLGPGASLGEIADALAGLQPPSPPLGSFDPLAGLRAMVLDGSLEIIELPGVHVDAQDTEYSCFPSALASALTDDGHSAGELDVLEELKARGVFGPAGTSIDGVLGAGVEIAKEHGATDAEAVSFFDGDRRASLQRVLDHVGAGKGPAVLCGDFGDVREIAAFAGESQGHAVKIVGYNPVSSEVQFMDPGRGVILKAPVAYVEELVNDEADGACAILL